MTFEQEGIIKKMITRSAFGLNQYNLVNEIQECSKHGDAFNAGAEAAHWFSECRILLRRISKQRPRSAKLLRLGPIPVDINNHIRDLAKVFEAINGENFPAVTADLFPVAKVTTTTGFYIAVGPAPDTSLPSFSGDCSVVYSYYPTPLSPIESLCDEVEKGSIQILHILDEPQLPHNPTFVKKLHRNENGQGHDEFIVEGHYGGPTPFDVSSRKDILQMIDVKFRN